MPTVSLYFNRMYLGEVEDPEVTPGVQYLHGRATSATVSIALGSKARARVATARSTDELHLVTAHGRIFQLLRSVLSGNVLTAKIEPWGTVVTSG